MAIGGDCGIRVGGDGDGSSIDPFQPVAGAYVVQVPESAAETLGTLCADHDVPCAEVARGVPGGELLFTRVEITETVSVAELRRAWRSGLSL